MDVPELVLIGVFNSLPVYEQLTARLVCKQWQRLIEENLAHSARELVLFANVRPHPLVWHYNDQPVNLDNSLIVNPKTEEARLFRELFRNIRRLYVVYCECNRAERIESEIFNFLNHFSYLEHLEVYDVCSRRFHRSSRVTLDFELPNLKTLFCDSKVQASPLIASPKLEQLAFFGNFHLDAKLACLKSLKLLKVFSFSHETDIELSNLEVLYFNGSLQIELAKFKMLREIHFADFSIRRSNAPLNEDESLRLVRAAFEELFKQKRRLGRDDLRVYFEGIRCEANSFRVIASRERLQSYQHHTSYVVIRPVDVESFQLNRGDFQVGNLRLYFEYSSQFDDVIAAMNDEQVERLARSLHTLMLAEQLNVGLLGKFQILFRYIQHLYIDEERFSQFDVLPTILPNLVSFWVVRRLPEGGYKLNLADNVLPASTTSKLEGLKNPVIRGTETSPDELKKMLDSCRFFSTLILRTGRYKAELLRWTSYHKNMAFYRQMPSWSNDELAARLYNRCRYHQMVNMNNFSNQQIVDCLAERKFFDEDSIETGMSSYDFSLSNIENTPHLVITINYE